MGNAANKAKTKWNSNHYSQLKFSVSPDIAVQFRAACAASGVSMASVLTNFILEYCQITHQAKPVVTDYLSTKRKRRKATEEIITKLEQIRDAQELSKDNIPENFRETVAYESAEHSVEIMEEAIELLHEIY